MAPMLATRLRSRYSLLETPSVQVSSACAFNISFTGVLVITRINSQMLAIPSSNLDILGLIAAKEIIAIVASLRITYFAINDSSDGRLLGATNRLAKRPLHQRSEQDRSRHFWNLCLARTSAKQI